MTVSGTAYPVRNPLPPRIRQSLIAFSLFFLGLSFGACGRPDEPPSSHAADADASVDAQDADTLLIATWNVERFFDTVCDSGRCESGDYEALPGQAEFNAETERIADGITFLSADVVLLEEIETQTCFDALLERVGGDFETAVFGETGAPASVDVAVLADGELIDVVRHRDQTPLTRPDGTETTFARELLEVRVAFSPRARAADTPDVIVFAAHFKSKANDDPGRRLAEAQAAHDIIVDVAARFPDALVVLGGDLNDTPGSDTLDALVSDDRVERVNSDIPPDRAPTYYLSGSGVVIDHIVRATQSAGAYVPRSSVVFRDGARQGFQGSDHGALRAEFLAP